MGFRHIDTRRMPREQIATNPGAARQWLRQDSGGGGVFMSYGPAGFTPTIMKLLGGQPHRHLHKTVTESHYILAGDYPIWHWRERAQPGDLTWLRRHSYLENRPGTIHGVVPDVQPTTPHQMLIWLDGGGTSIDEPEAETETFEVSMTDASEDHWPGRPPIFLQADEARWSAHPEIAGAQLLALSTDGKPGADCWLVKLMPQSKSQAIAGGGRWLYVVDGSATFALDGDDVPLGEGGFLEWDAGSTLTMNGGATATILCVGHNLTA